MKLKSKKLVCGVGINDVQGFSKTREGKNWYSVVTRAYSEVFKSRQPTYENVTVHPDWLTGSNFKNSKIHDHYVPGYCLDKDILVPGNKQYSEAACRYVPHYVNNVLIDRGNSRGDQPLGVSTHGKGFRANCRQLQQDGKSNKVYLGTFSTPELAHREWQRGKIKAIEIVIEIYKTEPMPLREIIAALKLRIRKLKNDIRKKRITDKL